MKSDLSPNRELQLLERLSTLARQRLEQQANFAAEFEAAVQECQQQQRDSWNRIKDDFSADLIAAEQAYDRELSEIESWFEREHSRCEFDYTIAHERNDVTLAEENRSSVSARDRGRRSAESKFTKAVDAAERQLQKDEKFRESFLSNAQTIREEADAWLQSCRLGALIAAEPDQSPSPSPAPDADVKTLRQLSDTLQADLAALGSLRLAALFQGNRFVVAVVSIWFTSVFPGVLVLTAALGMEAVPAAITSAVGLAVLFGVGGGLLAVFLFRKAKRQAAAANQVLRQHLAQAHVLAATFQSQSEERCKHRKKLAEKERQEKLEAVGHEYVQTQKKIVEQHLRQQCVINDYYCRKQASLCHERDTRLRQIVARHQPGLRRLQAQFQERQQQHHSGFTRRLENLRRQHEQTAAAQDQFWQHQLQEARNEIQELTGLSEQFFPHWQASRWQSWSGATGVPPAIRIGEVAVDAVTLLHGFTVDEPWNSDSTETISLPALLKFPEMGSLLIKASGEVKQAANNLLCSVMFRYLTAFPPGKVRFTILDPVGLGKDFSPFMHLADYNEQLVTNRIWTEVQQIHHRLADLTEHMENVLQMYLRSEFADIEQYNASAGEVAEPYRILVVANFPVNFNEAAAERLLSIITSGPRCGVYTLLSLDLERDLPTGFPLGDIESQCQVLEWEAGRFRMRGPFAEHLLQVDPAPPAEFIGRIVHTVGKRAKEVSKVEVPFSKVASAPDEWWEGNTDDGIEVAMGPAGARKLQLLQLGQGTSQHLLMAGKTGSGKSTLLHVLITNLALSYSPDQLELYLIDFKKGVEFKRYASYRLPHARVVAIESEREFGLSVMQKLDAEMQRRGNLFREAGVQSLKNYRDRRPEEPLPRILLLVDEFQELFIEEDRLAQDASLYLDRLVRQGRAFGIHVLLGSQTLAGEYTLPRSTIGQMAVRIALQCSEADAHLILSDNNMAARLLSRPGEAIYNDANGLVEGNHPFQVAWLSDQDSEQYLQTIAGLGKRRLLTEPPMIVFEGNRPADPSANPLLCQLLDAGDWPHARRAFPVWLGEPVAIQEPTSVAFRREGGKNLLLIGQNPDAGLAVLATAVVSLALQHPPEKVRNATVGAQFYLFDGSSIDEPHHGCLRRIGEQLPHPVTAGGFRELPESLNEIAEELERRMAENDLAAPSIYLMLYDLQRFRDIRKSDDEFGFSASYEESDSDTPKPEKQIATILRDGPAFGIHTLVWCDGWNNLNRTFDRATMGEFELRVLFQMSSSDSSLLIDSPVASKLGNFRALCFAQAQETLEKFRPYGLPDDEWIARLGQKLQARSEQSSAR